MIQNIGDGWSGMLYIVFFWHKLGLESQGCFVLGLLAAGFHIVLLAASRPR